MTLPSPERMLASAPAADLVNLFRVPAGPRMSVADLTMAYLGAGIGRAGEVATHLFIIPNALENPGYRQ